MEKMYGARHTLKYRLEPLRLIGTDQSMAAVATTLGLAVGGSTIGLSCNLGGHFETRHAAQSEVMDWPAFYNAKTLHSTLGQVSLMQFERNGWQPRQESPHNGLVVG